MSRELKRLDISLQNTSKIALRPARQRYFHLDWLRVILILNLIPFHVAWMMLFVPGFSNIPDNSVWAELLSIYVKLITPLHMPLLFAISGYSSAIALQKKTTLSYLKERVRRLLLPLISFMFLLSPILYYFWPSTIQQHNLKNFLFEFIPQFMPTILNGNSGILILAHLWFVAYLFIFTLICLPLFLFLKNSKARLPIVDFLSSSFGMFMPAFLFAATVILTSIWSFYLAYFSYNLIAFLLGYIICLDEKMTNAIDNNLRLWISLWGICTVIMVAIIRTDFPIFYFFTSTLDFQYFIYSLLAGLNIWSFLLAMLSLAKKYLSFSNGFLSYMSRSSYPYYILHSVVQNVVYTYTGWHKGVFSEFLILSILTLIWTGLCYEFVVKRVAVLRWLFGVKG